MGGIKEPKHNRVWRRYQSISLHKVVLVFRKVMEGI